MPFRTHVIIAALPIDLCGNNVFVEVEVVNSSLEYNLLLGLTYFYEMIDVVSSLFQVLLFPHQGNIVTINQLAYYTPNLMNNVSSNIPFVSESKSA